MKKKRLDYQPVSCRFSKKMNGKHRNPGMSSRQLRLSLWLGISIVFVVAWFIISPHYYSWVLAGERIDVIVYCDASVLNKSDTSVFVLYDQVALSPLAKMLGIFQNRPAHKIRSFFPLKFVDFEVKANSVLIRNVNAGPVSKIIFVSGNKQYHADVPREARIVNNTLIIRIESKLRHESQ